MTEALRIERVGTRDDAEWCARLMSSSEPWVTLRRGFDASLRLLEDPDRESYLARVGAERCGFLILCVKGVTVGHLQTVCLAPSFQGQGLGTRLIAFAEQRIFREFPNVFLSVSSFNPRARRLYERLGYHTVGELKDYIVRGHSEVLLRKSIGPSAEFARR